MLRPDTMRCSTCVYWLMLDPRATGHGLCRRYAPREQGHAVTDGSSWCGEFMADLGAAEAYEKQRNQQMADALKAPGRMVEVFNAEQKEDEG